MCWTHIGSRKLNDGRFGCWTWTPPLRCDLDLLAPKADQFMSVPRCTNDKSLPTTTFVNRHWRYHGNIYTQAGRHLVSAPSANVVAMATRVGPPGRRKHIRSIWHTSRLIGDFVQKIAQISHKFRCHGNKGRPTTFCMVPLNRPSAKTP